MRRTWVGLVSWNCPPADGGCGSRGQRQVGRSFVAAQGGFGAQGDFAEIDFAAFLEGQPEMAGGQGEQAAKISTVAHSASV